MSELLKASDMNNTIDRAADKAKKLTNEAQSALQSGVEQARDGAKNIVEATQNKVDSGADAIESAAMTFMDTVQKWFEQGKKSCSDMADTAKDKGTRATAACENYIKDEPLKAVGIAALAGAVIGGVYMMSRRRR